MKNPWESWFDLQVLFFVDLWFSPYYVLGKQDEWKEWTNTTLNGWCLPNLCKS